MNGSVARRCSTCKYHVGAGAELYCRFNPPVVHPVIGMTPQGPRPAGQVTLFPKVEPSWWCGQYEAHDVFADQPVEHIALDTKQ